MHQYWRIYNTFGKAYSLCTTIWGDYLRGPPYFMWPNYKDAHHFVNFVRPYHRLAILYTCRVLDLYNIYQTSLAKLAEAKYADDRQTAEAEIFRQQSAALLQTAKNAKDKQQGEANTYEANAKVTLQQAINAAELKKSEADKLFAEAKTLEEQARNALVRRGAEAQIIEQQARIEAKKPGTPCSKRLPKPTRCKAKLPP